MISSCRWGAVLLTAALVLACGGNNNKTDGGTGGGTGGGSTGGGAGGGTGGGTGGVALADYCNTYATNICNTASTCNVIDPATQASCVQQIKTSCAAGTVSKAQAGGRTYDPVKAGACLSVYGSGQCGIFEDSQPEACSQIYGPNRQPGQSCSTSSECVNGFCQFGGGNCGTCVAYVGVGSMCLGSGALRCDPTTSYCPSSNLTDGGLDDGGVRTCLARNPDGTPCEFNSTCQTGYCNYDGYLPDGGGTDTCGRKAAGTLCALPYDCAEGTDCVGWSFDNTSNTLTPGTCQPAPADYSVQANGTCYAHKECAAGLYCQWNDTQMQYDGVCTARVAANGVCDAQTYGDRDCAFGLSCGANDTCVGGGNLGTACADGQDCKALLTCPVPPTGEPTDGGFDGGAGAPNYFHCSGAVSIGGNCVGQDVSCVYGAFCDQRLAASTYNTCTAQFAPGTACNSYNQCQNYGDCNNPDGGVQDTTCQPTACY